MVLHLHLHGGHGVEGGVAESRLRLRQVPVFGACRRVMVALALASGKKSSVLTRAKMVPALSGPWLTRTCTAMPLVPEGTALRVANCHSTAFTER